MKKGLYILAFFILAFICYSTAEGEPVLINSNSENGNYDLAGKISIWRTNDIKKSNLAQAIIAQANNQFEADKSKYFNFGFTSDVIWLTFEVSNNTNQHQSLILSLGYPSLNRLDFFQLQNNKVVKQIKTGEDLNFNTREINHPNFLFRITLPPHKKNRIYLKIQSYGESLKAPLKLYDYKTFYSMDSRNSIFKGVFYGLMLFILCFNFFLLIVMKKKLYLFYNLFIISLTIFLLTSDGLLFKLFFQDYPGILNNISIIFASFTNLFLLRLTQLVIGQNSSKLLNNTLTSLLWISGIIALAGIFNGVVFYYAYIATHILSALTPVFICIASFYFLKNKHHGSVYFSISFLMFTLGALVFVLSNLGIIHYNQLTGSFLKGGFALQVIVLSFAVTERFKKIKDEAKQELKDLVTQRIKELREQNNEMLNKAKVIEKTNEDLEKLTIAAKEAENGVTVSTPKGEILYQNEGFRNLYGYGFDTLFIDRKANLKELYSNADIVEHLNTCLQEKRSVNFETCVENGKEKIQWVQTLITPIFDTDEGIKYLSVIDTDITYSKKTEEKLIEKNLNITHSIRTARRIQNSILPPEHIIKRLLPKSFIFLLPKDIVSGDFYFLNRKKNNIMLAAVDCTGHGVPGALMSIVAFIEINKAIKEKHLIKPSKILESVNEGINETLRITNEDNSIKEGLDIAFCSLNRKTNKLSFAGAHNPLYLIRDKELIEYKADKYPIGIYYGESEKKFTNNDIQLQKGDVVYIFSDGFADQFGGKHNRKYLSKRFKETLLGISELPIKSQEEELTKEFYSWKRDWEQVDDVLVIGFKI